MNSDDVYEPGALLKVAEYFTAHPGARWLTGRCRIINEQDREVRRPITAYKNFLLRHFSYSLLLVTNPISQPATFWKRDVIREIGLFDLNEHYVMDYDYWLRIGKNYPLAVLDDDVAAFRVYASSKTSSANVTAGALPVGVTADSLDSELDVSGSQVLNDNQTVTLTITDISTDDWATRSTATGVFYANRLDTTLAVSTDTSRPANSVAQRWGEGPEGNITLDTSIKVDGAAGSQRIAVLNTAGASAGLIRVYWGGAGGVNNIGPGETLWVSFRVRQPASHAYQPWLPDNNSAHKLAYQQCLLGFKHE